MIFSRMDGVLIAMCNSCDCLSAMATASFASMLACSADPPARTILVLAIWQDATSVWLMCAYVRTAWQGWPAPGVGGTLKMLLRLVCLHNGAGACTMDQVITDVMALCC